jgi:hypothetical protein
VGRTCATVIECVGDVCSSAHHGTTHGGSSPSPPAQSARCCYFSVGAAHNVMHSMFCICLAAQRKVDCLINPRRSPADVWQRRQGREPSAEVGCCCCCCVPVRANCYAINRVARDPAATGTRRNQRSGRRSTAPEWNGEHGHGKLFDEKEMVRKRAGTIRRDAA